jgi:hypothetical protein
MGHHWASFVKKRLDKGGQEVYSLFMRAANPQNKKRIQLTRS